MQLPICQNIALENSHHIGFDEVRLIDRATNYWDRIRREAIEIKLQPNNFNRDSGLHTYQQGLGSSNNRSKTTPSSWSTQHQCPSPRYSRRRSVYRTWRTPTLIGQQPANSAINKRATNDNKDEYSLYNQSVFLTAHILLKRATEL